MAYRTLHPDEVAILFADHQDGITDREKTVELGNMRAAVKGLAKLAKLFGIPVVATTAPSGGTPKLIEEITGVLGDLPLHTRNTTDSFLHAPTREAILATGRKTLLIAGVATEIIVQHTALSAAAEGFEVQVVLDACGGFSDRTEAAAIARMVQAGVVPTSLISVGAQLAGDLTSPQGQEARSIIFSA